MTPSLRPYQQDGANQIRQAAAEGCKRVLFVGVTSYGKTNLFCSMALRAFEKGKSLWVLTHRWTLFENTLETMRKWGVPCGAFDAVGGYDGQKIQVVMKDTLAARLKKGFMPDMSPDTLIMDEADLVESTTWQAAIEAFPNAFVLGFTGTPERADGKGLGRTFQKMILGPSPKWMMDEGHIARPIYMPFEIGEQIDIKGLTTVEDIAKKVDEKPKIVGDTVNHYLLHGKELPFLGSAITIAQCEKFSEAWNAAGIRSEVIHSKLPDAEQDRLFKALKSKEIRGLWSVDMISRGVDVPSIKYLCCARPTNSLAWWLQLLGRAIRKDGELRPIIADHVGNLFRLGTVEMDREWSLDGVSKAKRDKELLTQISQCPSCFAMFAKAPCCPVCGSTLAAQKERELKQREGELKAMEAKEIEEIARAKMEAKRAQGAAKEFDDLVRIGVSKKMRNPSAWAMHVLEARRKKLVERQALANA